ncbi:MAG: right-handed parallel beta-helix repeat-containing protein [bacterium]
MKTGFIILLSCLFATLNGKSDVVPSNGGTIANGRYVIPAGDYHVKITKEKGTWLTVGDNTELVIDGNIILEGNEFRNCAIIRVTGKNVIIHGKGSIVGDRLTHKGKDGEWGMGVYFHGATNATLSGLTIKNCWGDCVYIGKESGKITIKDCYLDHGRRQGISVTSADSVIVRNCAITNVSGTFPQYGIDIEPNMNCIVNYVLIDNVNIKNCEGGIRALVPKKAKDNSTIKNVYIHNCKVSALSRFPVHLFRCEKGTVKGCTVDASNDMPSIYANDVDDLKIIDNTLNVDVKFLASVVNKVKEMVGKSAYSPIRVVHSSTKGIKNNKINEQ